MREIIKDSLIGSDECELTKLGACQDKDFEAHLKTTDEAGSVTEVGKVYMKITVGKRVLGIEIVTHCMMH